MGKNTPSSVYASTLLKELNEVYNNFNDSDDAITSLIQLVIRERCDKIEKLADAEDNAKAKIDFIKESYEKQIEQYKEINKLYKEQNQTLINFIKCDRNPIIEDV